LPSQLANKKSHPSAYKSPQVRFISDSTLKSLVEDEEIQAALNHIDWENNILSFRGKSAQDNNNASHAKVTQFAARDIRQFVLSIDTVNLLNMAQDEIAQDAAADVINTIQKFLTHLSLPSQLVYIMPTTNFKMSSRSYSTFTEHIADFTGQQNLRTVSACYQMTKIVYSIHNKDLFDNIKYAFYDKVVHLCTTDGIHWLHELTHNIVIVTLVFFAINCTIKKNRLSCFYLAVQKHIHGC
jgi:hypothetical protein